MADQTVETTAVPPAYRRRCSGDGLRLAQTEWILTDGQGGYAMGTAAGIPTRRYHGWLVASTTPPVGRVLTLSSCVETLVENPGKQGERRHDLSSFHFPGGVVHPAGHVALTGFEAGITARWEYSLRGSDPIRVVRELCLLRHEQRGGSNGGGAAIVRYSVQGKAPFALEVRPLLAMRDFHQLLTGRQDGERFVVGTSPGVVGIEVPSRFGSLPRLNLACASGRYETGSQGWHDFRYPLDAERGQECGEDLFSPGQFVIAGDGAVVAELAVWTGDVADRARIGFDEAVGEQRERAAGVIGRAVRMSGTLGADRSAEIGALAAAADGFVVRRVRADGSPSTSVIAGYPWFADWGRDSMICLPGLMLATGRFEEALSTLETFAALCKDGLIPNWFDDTSGKAEYNTVDAALWFVHAACRYAAESKDAAVMRGPVGKACLEIVSAYRAGTRHGIGMDEDGLISAGDATTQLTWMDARRDGVVFTPRFGKAVEVNALWYNAMESLAGAIDEVQPRTARELRSLAEHAGASIRMKFWNARERCCHDVLVPDGRGLWVPTAEIRPNQIFAASLPFSALDAAQRAGVIECVRDLLVTPVGVRTLSPEDRGYIGRYRGPLFERDRAYHNGTAWPYLLGPYAEAVLRLGGFSAEARAEARRLLDPLIAEMDSREPGRMLGQIAEVYDGDGSETEPRRPSGCPAQAWSVAEALRVMGMLERAG